MLEPSSPANYNFPPDLERYIFELTFTEHRPVQLTRVSRQIQTWTEPLLYAKIELSFFNETTSELLMQTIASRSTSFFTATVKTILFHGQYANHEVFMAVMGKCQGVERVVIWDSVIPEWFEKSSVLNNITAPRLTHFTTPAFHPNPALLIRTSWFQQITHLSLYAPFDENLALQDLPCLTHMACGIRSFEDLLMGRVLSPDRVQAMLSRCRRLQVFWLISNALPADIGQPMKDIDEMNDLRVVCYEQQGQWGMLVTGQSASWDIPNTIAKRQLELGKRVTSAERAAMLKLETVLS